LFFLLLCGFLLLDIELTESLEVVSLFFNIGRVCRDVHVVQIIGTESHRLPLKQLDAAGLIDRRGHQQ
jgi:hypothetical protein